MPKSSNLVAFLIFVALVIWPTPHAKAILGSGVAQHPPTNTLTVTAFTTIAPASAGATFRISGAGFTATGNTVSCAGSGSTFTTATANGTSSGVNGTFVNVTANSGISAGAYTCTVTNALGATGSGGLTVTSTADPVNICGTSVVAWYSAANASSGTSISDGSGLGGVATGNATYNSSDAAWNNKPSLTFNGSSNYFLTGPLNIFNGGSSADVVIVVFFKSSASSGVTARYPAAAGFTYLVEPDYTTGNKPTFQASGTTAIWGSAVNTPAMITAIAPSAANRTISINVNNQTAVTAATTDTIITNNQPLSLGAAYTTAPFAYSNGSGTEWVVLNSVSAYNSCAAGLYQYFGNKYLTASSPSITSVTPADFASANGGETRTINGTGMAPSGGAISLTVGGTAATITSNTSTSVTFTVPASTVSSTNGNGSVSTVTYTNFAGSASTSGSSLNSLWYVPKYFGVTGTAAYTAQDVTTTSGNVATIVDLSGNGFTGTPTATGPAYTSTGGGSGANLPYMTFAGTTTDNRLENSSFPSVSSGVGTWVIGANLTSAGGANIALAGMGATDLLMLGISNGSTGLSQFNGSQTNTVTLTNGADFYDVGIFTGSSTSSQQLNGGSAVTGGNPGSGATGGGVVLGGRYNNGASSLWHGRIYTAVFYPSSLGATAVSNWNAYFVNEGL